MPATDAPKLNRVEDVTAEWATAALSGEFPGTVVTSLYVGTVIYGTAAKARLLMSYNEAGLKHRLPPTMWLKCGVEATGTEFDLSGLYANEASFYAELAPTFDIELAKPYVSTTNPRTGQSFVLLEDLLGRHAKFQSAPHPLSPDMAAQVLTWQAGLHARYWNAPELKTIPWLNNGAQYDVMDKFMNKDVWDRCMGLSRSKMVPPPLRDFDKVRGGIIRMMQHDRKNAHCVVHGDTHLGNVYITPDQGPGYCDWQCLLHGFWAHDVGDFMTTAMSVEDRRHSERDLIAHYVKALGERGVTLAFDEAWLQYRRHGLYNLTWLMNLPEWQPDEINNPNTERACAAVLDLDCFGAWD